MKQLIIVIFLIFMGQAVLAQDSDTSHVSHLDSSDHEFAAKWERLFSSMDMDEVTTGFFLDRAVTWITPIKHQGVLDENEEWVDDSNYYETIVSLHESFLVAQTLDSPSVLFDSTEALRATVNTYLNNGKIPVLGFYMDFNHIRDSAFIDSLLYLDQSDSSIHDVPGRSSTPFSKKSVFASAFGVNEIEQGDITFRVPSELYMSNSNKTLTLVELKCGAESDWVTILPDSDLIIDLNLLEGDYVFETRYTYLDGTILLSKNPVFFKKKPGTYVGPYQNAGDVWPISVNANHGDATVTIAYGCGKTKLTKPFIIVEPFDPTNTHTFTSIRYMLTQGSTEMSNLVKELEAQGYDLVYIDFASNTDYLERNTALVKDVINLVNSTKSANGSTETNVVMGISMGGVLGRNALRTMELATQNHQTSLFISVDAPHKGAYIPISLQWALHNFDDLSHTTIYGEKLPLPGSLDKALAVLGSPAAKQLLVLNVLDQSKTAHVTFFNQYNANGPLEHCREIAVTNGSIVGKKQQDKAGVEILDGSLLGMITQPGITTPWFLLFSGFQAKGDFFFWFYGISTTNKTVYKGQIALHAYFWSLGIQYDLYPLKDELIAFAPPYDNAPGGFQATGEAGIPNINSVMSTVGGTSVISTTDKFCFVPTVSSLGISNYDLSYDVNGQVDQSYFSSGGNTYYYYVPKALNTTIFFKNFSCPVVSSATPIVWNESHSRPTSVSGAVLPLELLALPRVYSSGLTTISGSGATFNYGYKWGYDNEPVFTTGKLLYNDVSVESSGKLLINGDAPMSFDNSGLDDPGSYSSFEVATSGATCDGTAKNITVENTGEIVLGSVTDSRTGILRLSYGSTLYLKSGSKITAYNNSKIVAGNGSIIKIDGTADIVLDDINSKIEFEEGGVLNIESGGTFTFTGDGFVAFEANHNDAFESIIGDGTFSITGSSKTDKVLEINPPAALPHNVAGTFQVSSDLAGFEINYAKVDVNHIFGYSDLVFQMHPTFTIDHATLAGLAIENYNTFTADYSDIGSVICYANTDVDHCHFENSDYGLLGYNVTSGSDKIKVQNSTFEWSGLYMYDCASDLNTLTFNGVGTLKAETMSLPTIFQHIEMDAEEEDQNLIGIDYSGTGTTVELYRSHIKNAITAGVQVENAELTANCGSVTNDIEYLSNAVAINLKTDAILTLDPSLYTGAGHVDFSNYPVTIACSDADDIHLNNGYANLGTSAPGNGAVLSGTINAFYYPSTMNAEHNRWSLSGYVVPNQWDHYRYFYEATIDPIYFNRRAVVIGTSNYLTSAPDITCIGSGGGGDAKRDSRRDGLELPLGAGANLPFTTSSTLKTAIEGVFAANGISPKTLSTQLSQQAAILKHNYGELEEMALPAKNITYQKMVNTVSEGVANGFIKRDGAIPSEIGQIIDIQDHLLTHQPSLTYAKKFDLTMDKAFSYRLAGKLQEALNIVNEVSTWSEYKNLPFVNKWQCQLNNEILLQSKTITIREFAKNVKTCSSYSPEENTVLQPGAQTQSQIKQIASAHDAVLIYPNPAKDLLTIAFGEGSIIKIVLTDITGKQISEIPVQANQTQITAPINLENGIYFLNVTGEKMNYIKKFTVLR